MIELTINRQNLSRPEPGKVEWSGFVSCAATPEQCAHTKECANHNTAGDFRSESGELPAAFVEEKGDELRVVCPAELSNQRGGCLTLVKGVLYETDGFVPCGTFHTLHPETKEVRGGQHLPLSLKKEGEFVVMATKGHFVKFDRDALTELSQRVKFLLHTYDLDDWQAREKRKIAPQGKFRVIGYDSFSHEDWVDRDLDSLEEAKKWIDGKGRQDMTSFMVFDDKGEEVYSTPLRSF
jgi:hypothetical protein